MPHSLQPLTSITTNAQTIGPWDCTQYEVANVVSYGTHAGITLAYEGSLDGVNWFALSGYVNATTGQILGSSLLTTNANTSHILLVGAFSYFRVRSTTYTSGTASVQVAFDSITPPLISIALGNTPTLGTGTNTIGQTIPLPSATVGGVTLNHHLVAAATTNSTSVKAGTGSIASIVLVNTAAAVKYFKLFNKVIGPTVGTDTPVVTFGIPAGVTLTWDPTLYYRMTAGIAYAITNLSPDLDNTAVTAGDVIVSMQYI